eukprot:2356282-Amphidinium_carterae.2
MAQKDEEYHLKILEASCCISRSDPFGPKQREAWRDEYVARMRSHSVLGQLEVKDDGEISWSSSGIFRLLPVMPAALAEAQEHKYIEIRMGSWTVSLQEFVRAIDGTWELQQNWDVHKAFVMRPGSSRELRCKDWFDGAAGFTDFVAAMYKFVEPPQPKGRKVKQEGDESFSLKRKRTFREYVKADAVAIVSPDAKKKEEVTETLEPLQAPRSGPKRLAR